MELNLNKGPRGYSKAAKPLVTGPRDIKHDFTKRPSILIKLKTAIEEPVPQYLDRMPQQVKSQVAILVLSIAGLVSVGIFDHWTGVELSFSLFYVGPVLLSTWYLSGLWGSAMALISGIVWLYVDTLGGIHHSQSWIPFWNAGVRLAFFLTIVLLLSKLKTRLDREKEIAVEDLPTGIGNARLFSERLSREIVRSRRYKHPFSLLYLDLDNFKSVNDHFGHSEGNALLRVVAQTIKKSRRPTDTVARLGGDEFAVLLPETDFESAGTVCALLQTELATAIQFRNWPVTVSIGAATFGSADGSADAFIQKADQLMYLAKRKGKNRFERAEYP